VLRRSVGVGRNCHGVVHLSDFRHRRAERREAHHRAAARRLGGHVELERRSRRASAAFDTPSRYAAWKTIRSWYFISSGDQIIAPTSERAMAARAHSAVTEFEGGSHLTLISHPDAVTAVILDAVHSVT
jgi:pimeloyl-ACP methyl ester carboxylesterase